MLFPIGTRKSVGQEIVRSILSGSTPPSALPTCVHVRVMLECIGQSFSLPLDAPDIIESSIELYKRWLIDERLRPVPIQEDPQFFVIEMLKHLSQVFVLRPQELSQGPPSSHSSSSSSSSSHRSAVSEQATFHAKICSEVLEIMRLVSRKIV